MAVISNGNLEIRREEEINIVKITFDIEWNDEELRLRNVPFFAELAFRGDDRGLRGGRDDKLFVQLFELTERGNFSNLRPSKFEEEFEYERNGPFSLDEDKPKGRLKSRRRRTDRDEIFVRVKLLPSSLGESNQIRTNNARGRF